MADPVERMLAAIAGAAAVLLSLYCSVWVMLGAMIAAQRPDPAVPDGDPCCAHPDTWSEVADRGFEVLSFASVVGLVFAGGVACLAYGWAGRWPRRRRLRWIPAAAVALTAAGMATALAASQASAGF
jgi:hypothetical protein